MRRLIGITGGIGSGKSVVARIARCNGFFVYDCDLEARRLMQEDSRLVACLKSLFGEEAYLDDNSLDRKYVASRIFREADLREKVNNLVHSAVKEDFLRFAESKDSKVFVESAILFSSHLAEVCDSVWMVIAPEEVRISRVMARNNVSADEVKERIRVQSEEFSCLPEEKTEFLDNGGEVPILEKILKLLDE